MEGASKVSCECVCLSVYKFNWGMCICYFCHLFWCVTMHVSVIPSTFLGFFLQPDQEVAQDQYSVVSNMNMH